MPLAPSSTAMAGSTFSSVTIWAMRLTRTAICHNFPVLDHFEIVAACDELHHPRFGNIEIYLEGLDGLSTRAIHRGCCAVDEK